LILSEGFIVENFPYLGEMLNGILAHLLKSKALNLQRNALATSSTSGTAVDDKGPKARAYLELSEKYFEQFDDRIKAIKQHTNIESGYGYLC
jgi:hypothetical protein